MSEATLTDSEVLLRLNETAIREGREAMEAEAAAEQAAAAAILAEEQEAALAELAESRTAFAKLRDTQHRHLLKAVTIRDEYLTASKRYASAKRAAMAAGVPETGEDAQHDVVTASKPLSEYDLRKEVEEISTLFRSGVQ